MSLNQKLALHSDELRITNISLIRTGILYLIKQHSETYIIINTMMKQSKVLNNDPKSEHKKSTDRTTVVPTTKTDSEMPTFWNKLKMEL